MKKKVTILFHGDNLSYSPTVIGLYDLLSKEFDVTIIARSPVLFDNKQLTNRKVIYIKSGVGKNFRKLNNKIFNLLSRFNKRAAQMQRELVNLETLFEFRFIKKYLERDNPDFIIAVDFRNLWYAQLLHKKVEFLSLEIIPDDLFYERCSFENINSVIIQTRERYEHLFKDKEFKTFFIQNAPIYTVPPAEMSNSRRRGLVFCGTAWEAFGFYHCLDFLREFTEYTLNVKGALLFDDKLKVETDYRDLILSKRLIIDSDYLDDVEVVDYLRPFRIGFCFYNFELKWVNNFNYYSAPSGKMFKYMAAGVPVIGQNILGLNPVKEFDCGVLIDDLKPETIKKAIDTVENNFDYYSNNCFKAAEYYSFDKATEGFINYLKNQ